MVDLGFLFLIHFCKFVGRLTEEVEENKYVCKIRIKIPFISLASLVFMFFFQK